MNSLTKDYLRTLANDARAGNGSAIALAERILFDFANERVDVADDAMDEFRDFLQDFGTTYNVSGERVLTEAGAAATLRYERIVSQLERVVEGAEDSRFMSLTSDKNQMLFDAKTLTVYKNMGLVDAGIDPANMTPAAIAKLIDETPLNPVQQEEYAEKLVDVIIDDKDLFELVPPKILAEAYVATKSRIAATDGPDRDASLQRFATIASRIDHLIKNASDQIDYCLADPSNIADVYAGYKKMMDVRRPDLAPRDDQNAATKTYNAQIADEIKTAAARLDEIISEYDRDWNLENLTERDAEKLKTRWDEISDLLNQANVSEDVLAAASNYKFLDESGNPIPQFIDSKGKPSLEYKPGYKLDENGRLARIISLAKNDVTMKNVGDLAKEVNDKDLADELDDRIPWKFAEISIPDQAVQGALKSSDALLDENSVKKIWDEIKTNGGEISDMGYQAALDNQVNQVAGYASRLADKIGRDKEVLFKPLAAVEDIDKLAQSRSEKNGAASRKKKIGLFKRAMKNFTIAAAMSAGLTFIGKATGVSYVGAAIGTTVGIGNIAYQAAKWRREQKKAGRPHGIKTFLKDKRNWAPAVTSGLGVAAVISMSTGNPELAMAFGMGAISVSGVTGAATTYKDAVRAGYSRGAAIVGALGVGVSGVAGAIAGGAAMNSLVDYINNNTESTLFKTDNGSVRQYNEGVIENNERILNMWEDPAQLNARLHGLMAQGLSHDDAVRYLMAFHDATDHNLGPGYFQSIGMSDDALAALRGSISGSNVNLTPESIAAFEHFNPHISATNTVGYIDGAPVDYRLPPNAQYDASGRLVPGGDVYSTYTNHGPVFSTHSIFTPNELAFPAGIGTMGMYHARPIGKEYISQLRERAGALMDRAVRLPVAQYDNNTTPDKDSVEFAPGTNSAPNVDDRGTVDRPSATPASIPMPAPRPASDFTPDPAPAPRPAPAPESNAPSRGFFGNAKDIIYKIMRATKNGTRKTIKGIQEMNHEAKSRRIKNQTERAKLKADREAARKDLALEKINNENAQRLARLQGDIKREMASLRGELGRDTVKKNHARQQQLKDRVQQLKLFQEDLKLANEKAANKDSLLAARTLDFELKKIDISMAKYVAKSDQDLKKIQARGKKERADISVSNARYAGQKISGFFKGMRDVRKEDVDSAKNATKVSQHNATKAKSDVEKKILEAASKKLRKLAADTKLSDQEKRLLAKNLIDMAEQNISA